MGKLRIHKIKWKKGKASGQGPGQGQAGGRAGGQTGGGAAARQAGRRAGRQAPTVGTKGGKVPTDTETADGREGGRQDAKWRAKYFHVLSCIQRPIDAGNFFGTRGSGPHS